MYILRKLEVQCSDLRIYEFTEIEKVLSCSIYAPIRDWGPENRSWCQGSHRCLDGQHHYFVCLIVILKPEITASLFKKRSDSVLIPASQFRPPTSSLVPLPPFLNFSAHQTPKSYSQCHVTIAYNTIDYNLGVNYQRLAN